MSVLRQETGADIAAEKWMHVAHIDDFPADAGACVELDGEQIAIFNFAASNEWYACQNRCPHRGDMVLARGLIGDQNGVPKVACPLHKKTFSLCDGQNISGGNDSIATYDVKVENGEVYLNMDMPGE